jgi:IS5 family transposase
MIFFKSQCTLDFDQPIWDNDSELFIMDTILDKNPHFIKEASSCFPNVHHETKATVGRAGMTLEQIVRAAFYKFYKRLNFRDLSDHTEDSKKGRRFMKMEYGQYFSYQALQANISKINSDILKNIYIKVNQYALALGVDDGKKVRMDSTVIKTNIHHPTNATLLWDCIRVSCRLVMATKKLLQITGFRNYQKNAKKLLFKIVNTKGKDKRRPLFKKMLKAASCCERQVEQAIEQLSSHVFSDQQQEKQRKSLFKELSALLKNMKTIIDVAYRFEINDEEVPVSDKLFSLFEDHTDCIKKGGRQVLFGHKVNFSSGKSNLILDCILEQGNPSDINYFPGTLDNIHQNYGVIPRDVATDGCYASKDNLLDAIDRGIVNIVFNKVKGSMQNIASSKKMETMLKKWRSGIEAVISNFKRGLNASTCTWKGWEAFQCFVLWCLITFNMRIIAQWVITHLK